MASETWNVLAQKGPMSFEQFVTTNRNVFPLFVRVTESTDRDVVAGDILKLVFVREGYEAEYEHPETHCKVNIVVPKDLGGFKTTSQYPPNHVFTSVHEIALDLPPSVRIMEDVLIRGTLVKRGEGLKVTRIQKMGSKNFLFCKHFPSDNPMLVPFDLKGQFQRRVDDRIYTVEELKSRMPIQVQRQYDIGATIRRSQDSEFTGIPEAFDGVITLTTSTVVQVEHWHQPTLPRICNNTGKQISLLTLNQDFSVTPIDDIEKQFGPVELLAEVAQRAKSDQPVICIFCDSESVLKSLGMPQEAIVAIHGSEKKRGVVIRGSKSCILVPMDYDKSTLFRIRGKVYPTPGDLWKSKHTEEVTAMQTVRGPEEFRTSVRSIYEMDRVQLLRKPKGDDKMRIVKNDKGNDLTVVALMRTFSKSKGRPGKILVDSNVNVNFEGPPAIVGQHCMSEIIRHGTIPMNIALCNVSMVGEMSEDNMLLVCESPFTVLKMCEYTVAKVSIFATSSPGKSTATQTFQIPDFIESTVRQAKELSDIDDTGKIFENPTPRLIKLSSNLYSRLMGEPMGYNDYEDVDESFFIPGPPDVSNQQPEQLPTLTSPIPTSPPSSTSPSSPILTSPTTPTSPTSTSPTPPSSIPTAPTLTSPSSTALTPTSPTSTSPTATSNFLASFTPTSFPPALPILASPTPITSTTSTPIPSSLSPISPTSKLPPPPIPPKPQTRCQTAPPRPSRRSESLVIPNRHCNARPTPRPRMKDMRSLSDPTKPTLSPVFQNTLMGARFGVGLMDTSGDYLIPFEISDSTVPVLNPPQDGVITGFDVKQIAGMMRHFGFGDHAVLNCINLEINGQKLCDMFQSMTEQEIQQHLKLERLSDVYSLKHFVEKSAMQIIPDVKPPENGDISNFTARELAGLMQHLGFEKEVVSTCLARQIDGKKLCDMDAETVKRELRLDSVDSHFYALQHFISVSKTSETIPDVEPPEDGNISGFTAKELAGLMQHVGFSKETVSICLSKQINGNKLCGMDVETVKTKLRLEAYDPHLYALQHFISKSKSESILDVEPPEDGNISGFTAKELAGLLQHVGFSEETVSTCLSKQIDGKKLCEMNVETVKTELKLADDDPHFYALQHFISKSKCTETIPDVEPPEDGNISGFTAKELAGLLQHVGFSKETVSSCLSKQIDGKKLCGMNVKTVKTELRLKESDTHLYALQHFISKSKILNITR